MIKRFRNSYIKKRQNKLIVFLLFALLNTHYIFSQDTLLFHYKVNGKTDKDIPYLGMEYEFEKRRCILRNNVLKEISYYNDYEKETKEYKLIGNRWYYKNRRKWQLFFDFNTKQGGSINNQYRIHFLDTIQIQQKKLYAVVFKATNFVQSHIPVYLLDAKEGLVLISYNDWGVNIVRTDFFNNSLVKEDEQRIFDIEKW